MSDLQLRVIQRIHKSVTEVHSEYNQKFKYCKKCISGENKGIKNKRFAERSLGALSGEVQKFLRERFNLYFHVRKHKKYILFIFKIIISTHKEV